MKKFLIGLFMFGAAFAFAACSSTPTDQNVTFESNDQVFAIEALSAASLLDYSNIQMTNFVPLAETTTVPATTDTTTATDTINDEDIATVDQYLEMMNNFLGDNNALSVQTLTSDRAEWDNLMTFTTVNIAGEDVVFYLYYNETLFNSETVTTTEPVTTEPATTDSPTTEAPTTEVPTTTAADTTAAPLANTQGDKERNFYFEDADDNDVVYLLSGLVISDGIEYNVEGKRVIEDNGDEVLRLRAFVDPDNFVKVAYKLDAEDSAKKFFFENVQNGELVSSSKVKVLEEDGSLKVFLDLASNGDEARYMFKVFEEDGTTLYLIKYDITYADGTTDSGNIHIVATVDPVTGEVVYTYKVLDPQSPEKGPHNYRFEVEKRHQGREHRDEHANNGHGQM